MWPLAFLLACSPTPGGDPGSGSDTSGSPDVALVRPGPGQLLIEEIYTCGAPPAGGTDHYFSDQFVELVNAADLPLDLSGVLLGEVHGSAGEINVGMAPDSYRDERPDDVVLRTVWRIPEGVTLDPGETLVIAHDGVNHRPFSSVDLSGAGLESWVDSGQDDDAPLVPNLEAVHVGGGYDWLMTVFGPSLVVLRADTELKRHDGGALRRAPVRDVLDGVDTLMDADSAAYKRLPDAVDRGFTFVSGIYVGESVQRRRVGAGWQDTDDSGADFVVGAPSPTFATGEGTVGEDAWIELGGGALAFAPLDDGDPVELVAGPQGGFHVDVALRFGGIGPGGLQLVYDAVDAATAEVVSFQTLGTVTEASVAPTDGGWVRLGDRVVLDVIRPADVVGRDVVLRVAASLGGVTISDTRRVRVVDED